MGKLHKAYSNGSTDISLCFEGTGNHGWATAEAVKNSLLGYATLWQRQVKVRYIEHPRTPTTKATSRTYELHAGNTHIGSISIYECNPTLEQQKDKADYVITPRNTQYQTVCIRGTTKPTPALTTDLSTCFRAIIEKIRQKDVPIVSSRGSQGAHHAYAHYPR